jgi:segregation and condensation protein A
MSLTIQLPKFEGPLALLLYLIRKEEMDIMDIKVNQITSQYLEYIKLMKELDLELAGEFIAMAATLIHIKSRMLLPQYNENGELVEHEDPRKELVQRLLEYQKYQEAGKAMYERPLLGRDVYARGIREKLGNKEEEIVLEENALFSLITAYRSCMRSIKNKVHQVAAKTQSIASRILDLRDKLIVGTRTLFSEILGLEKNRRQVLITFLSLLELGKMGIVSLYQTEAYQEIYIETKKQIEENIADHVEEYDSVRSEQIASAMSFVGEEEILKEDFVSLEEEVAVIETSDEQMEIATDEEIMAEDIGEV